MGWHFTICMLLSQYISQQQQHRISILPNIQTWSSREITTHLNNCSRYYGNNKGKIILEEFHKLWKHQAAHLKDLHHRKENPTEQSCNNSTKFEICPPAMVQNHAHHTFKPKYSLDYKISKRLNDSTLLIMMLNLAAQQNLSQMLGICFWTQ